MREWVGWFNAVSINVNGVNEDDGCDNLSE